ncbi:MAG TPA: ABC transporter substrate-binding protein, partial [Ktedonobacterales bacterium]|nr:ABC transporter substrate-binding protein [Ktedonobacterales bacterium]
MASAQPRSFGQLLKHYRIAAGLTQEALAERAGLAVRSISDLERGLRHRPYADTLGKLVAALQLSMEERAQLEAAARRRGVPSVPRSPDVSAGLPIASSAPTAGATAPPDPKLDWGVPAGLLPPLEHVVQVASPRPRSAQATRLVSALLAGAVLGGTLLSAGVAGHSLRAGGGTLCLATDLPTRGKDAWQGKPAENAVNLAVQQNQNLGDGYALKVINYDDVFPQTGIHDPSTGAQNVTDMVKNPCIVGMVGPYHSSVAAAEMPITATAGLAMISPSNTDPGLTLRPYAGDALVAFDQLHPAGKKTNYFRNIANDAFQGSADANFTFGDLGARSAYVVADHSPYGEGLAGGFTQEFLRKGGAIVGTVSLPFANPSVIAQVAAR